MNALAARRRHPAAIAILLLLGLVAVGGAYSLLAPKQAQASVVSAGDINTGKSLFLANCATCHGMNAQGSAAGPTLVGVGAASVDFQVGTGRMPLAAPNVQAQRQDTSQFTQEQIANMAAWVASLAPGPAIPGAQYTSGQNADVAQGGEIFRINCAQCHNYAGSGGALSRGKYAPSLTGSSGKTIYEAMLTGPQSMPVFSDSNISAQNKNNIIAYLKTTQTEQQVGGMTLGNLGPVSEGMFIWIFGLGLMLGCAFWLGQKAA
ncbi:c-type cytochrome [Lapillicoccus sp.]|uniref:cytochrome bc1 complex diheme cytochrome c subunit n=1 Tax=Lapillicoccus sp. TaxID=1909287 RepID=UPI0025ED3E32|nr:c-type cytochrome [Lapillicoccus sp.]